MEVIIQVNLKAIIKIINLSLNWRIGFQVIITINCYNNNSIHNHCSHNNNNSRECLINLIGGMMKIIAMNKWKKVIEIRE